MANQRPINRRPWRRAPWARAKKRPTRWNAVLGSIIGEGQPQLQNTAVFPAQSGGHAPTHVLVDGQVDVEPWADEQEVTLDRIVGSFSLYGYAVNEDSQLSPYVPYLKCGIVLIEELTDETPAPTVNLDLFDQESCEDTEWMWLWAGFPSNLTTDRVSSTSNPVTNFMHTIEVDIKNRRKIGQKDMLAFYAQWASPTNQYNISVQSYADVRTILMSR